MPEHEVGIERLIASAARREAVAKRIAENADA